MRYRMLGKTGFKVSEIGYGAWGIAGDWWKGSTDEEAVCALNLALDHGVNFIDTALGYGDGHSEHLVSQVVRGRSERVYVATKMPPKNYGFPAKPGTPLKEAFPEEWIIKCTEDSLKNLNLERIDLQQFHVWLDEWADNEEWKEAVTRLKEQGKIAAVGLSLNFPLAPGYGALAIQTGLIDTCMVVYNIYEQVPGEGLFPLALERNIGIITRCPLDEGALTGRITPDTEFPEGDWRASYFRGERKREVYEHAQALQWLVHGDVGSLAEAALRFCLSHKAVSTVVVGMRKLEHILANVRASDKGPLPPADLARLKDHAWPHNFWE
ncbi:MAG: aldo/keto reductase [Chloroflexi bacterium]|nr:aldo/keto reductase [Chloroflexota bacterium]MCL5075923.1 aldo/keto reductase [Chloroflexota bacterium]